MMTSAQISASSPSLRRAALVTGIASLVMAAAAGFAEMGMRQALILPNDALATAQNLLAHSATFAAGILCYGIVLVCDLLAAWGYDVFLRPVHAGLSRLAAWLRIVYTAIFAVAIGCLVLGNRAMATDPESAMRLFAAYEPIWQAGLFLFGGHLVLIGWLAWRSGSVPKILGGLLLAAGLGYAINGLAFHFLPDYDAYKAALNAVVGLPSILGEIGMAIWLLVRGGRART